MATTGFFSKVTPKTKDKALAAKVEQLEQELLKQKEQYAPKKQKINAGDKLSPVEVTMDNGRSASVDIQSLDGTLTGHVGPYRFFWAAAMQQPQLVIAVDDKYYGIKDKLELRAAAYIQKRLEMDGYCLPFTPGTTKKAHSSVPYPYSFKGMLQFPEYQGTFIQVLANGYIRGHFTDKDGKRQLMWLPGEENPAPAWISKQGRNGEVIKPYCYDLAEAVMARLAASGYTINAGGRVTKEVK